MEELREQLVSLQELSGKIGWEERRRQQQKLISKTLSLINKLEAVNRQLKSSTRTSGDIVKHMKLLTEFRLLYRADELQSPLNCIKREMELINKFYSLLMQTYQGIIEEFTADSGII